MVIKQCFKVGRIEIGVWIAERLGRGIVASLSSVESVCGSDVNDELYLRRHREAADLELNKRLIISGVRKDVI